MTKTILVVEDNYDDRILMSHILGRMMNLKIDAVKDGIDAILKAEGQQYDLIVLDLHLPNLQGWDVIRALRDTARYKHTPMIAVTAHDHSYARLSASTAGCDVYLVKPIDVDKLAQTVTTLLDDAA